MFAEFKHRLSQMRGGIIGWSIGLVLYGLMMSALYGSVIEMEGLQEMMDSYPPELMAFFGDTLDLLSPVGYVSTYYFTYMPMIIGVFAVTVCAGLLVGGEEKGLLDLEMAYPVTRLQLLMGRVLAFVTAATIIIVCSWLSWALPAGQSGLGLSALDLLWPFLPLLALLILYGAITLLLSLILPAARLATMAGGALMVGDFLFQGLARLDDSLAPVAELLPLHFFQGGEAINGLNWGWLGGLLLVGAVCFALAGWLFQRRDIRVGGERGWRLPLVMSRR